MVQFRIQFGDRRGGGRGFRTVPIYALTDWRATTDEGGSLSFRPSWKSVWRRAAITLVAAVFLGLLWWPLSWPRQPDRPVAPAPRQQAEFDADADELQAQFEATMTPEQRQRFADRVERAQRDRDRRLDAARADLDRTQRVGRAVRWTLSAALTALGLLPLLLAAWERIDLRNGPHGELIVRRRRFLTRERSWPQGAFGGVQCSVVERIHRSRRSWPHHLGWFWQVRLLPRDEQGDTATRQFVDDPFVEFHVARQPDRPLDEQRPPKRVRSFIQHVCRLAGLDPRAAMFGIVPDAGVEPRGLWQSRRPRFRKRSLTFRSEPTVESAEYSVLEEMPPEIQARVRELMKQGIPPEGITEESVRITIRDADGHERTYTSLDDLPPEVRSMYDSTRRERRRP